MSQTLQQLQHLSVISKVTAGRMLHVLHQPVPVGQHAAAQAVHAAAAHVLLLPDCSCLDAGLQHKHMQKLDGQREARRDCPVLTPVVWLCRA
jgi:hypothetical protein